MKLITREELENYLDFNNIFNETKEGFVKFSSGQTITPPFTVFEIPENSGSVHFKYGYVIGNETFSFKYSGAFYENDKKDISNFLGLFVIFNAETGEAELVIDDKGFLTDYRTGIAGSLATKTLARENSEIVAVVGTGVQARMQIQALLKVMSGIKELNVYGRNVEAVSKYCDDIIEQFPFLKINVCDSVQKAVNNADIIYTVTYSEEPILKREWIREGTHITAVGACGPKMQELDESLTASADLLVVDSIEAASTHGELHHALEKRLIDKAKAIELGTVIASEKIRNDHDITICDLIGIGFQDAAIGNCIYRKLIEINNQN